MAADAQRRSRWAASQCCSGCSCWLACTCLQACDVAVDFSLVITALCVFPPCHRYDHALNKANYASLALRPEAASTAAAVADEDDGAGEEEEDLYASLAK